MKEEAAELDLKPQAAHMASEAMVRTLSPQAEAIWPLEAAHHKPGLPTMP